MVWNKSSEMSRIPGGGGLSLIQSLVSLCDPVQVEARLSKHLCSEVTRELRGESAGVMIAKISKSQENVDQVGRWAKLCLGTTRDEVANSVLVQQMFKVMELCLVQEGEEIRLEKLLVSRYPDQVWSVRHPVMEEGNADWSTITMVKMLPSGHAMVYTDMDWQGMLARLDQELQEMPRTKMSVERVKPGALACASWSDVKLSNEEVSPLSSPHLARVLVLSVLTQGVVEVFLIDHGCRGIVSASALSLLPNHLSSLPPCIVVSRLQGMLPRPNMDLLSPSILALSSICNSKTVISLLTRPSLTSSRIFSQLLFSPQPSLSSPAISVLFMMVTTTDSRKLLLLSPICLQLVLPALVHLLATPTLPAAQVLQVLECLLIIFSNLPPPQVQPFYQDGGLVQSLTMVQGKLGESQYIDMVRKLLCLDD